MAEGHEAIDLILQESLEQIQSGQATLDGILAQYPDLAEELRPPLEAALWFRMRKATLDPRPGYVSASRRRVVERIGQEQAAKAVPIYTRGVIAIGQLLQNVTVQRRLAFQLAALVLLMFLLVGGSGGAARAAQKALPGEPLYGVKIMMEKAALALAVEEGEKAELHIRYAQRRLAEIQALIEEDRQQYIPVAVTQYEEHINLAIRHMIAVRRQDQGMANMLAASLQSAMEEWVGVFRLLAESVPEDVQEQIDRIMLVSAGVVGLLEDTVADIPLPAIVINTPTTAPTETPGSTPEVAVSTSAPTATLTPSPMASATSGVIPTFVVIATDELPVTETPTATLAIIADTDEDETKPTKTPKPTKDKDKDEDEDKIKDKDKKDKDKDKDKDLPVPPRRPVDPPNDR